VQTLLPEAIDSVPGAVLDNLTAAEMDMLSNDQLSALTDEQVAAGFAVNAFNNLSPERLLLVDRVPPESPTYALSTGSTIGAQTLISGSAEPNTTVVLTLDLDNDPLTDNNVVYTVEVPPQGTWSVNLASAVPTSGELNFANGDTVGIHVVAQDAAGNISDPTQGTTTVSTQTLYTIQMVDANDQPVTGVNEGEVARFMVTRSGDLSSPGSVAYATENGTATSTADADYTAASGTLSFAAGVAKQYITVTTTADAVIEPNETLTLRLSNPTGGTLSTSSVQAVVNDINQSTWSVQAVASEVSEQNGKAVFTVTRTGASGPATVEVVTAGGSASAGADYTQVANARLQFAEGQLSQTFEVSINNDTDPESIETLQVTINNPSAGTIAQSTASVSIIDNDQSIWSIASNGDVSESAGKAYFTVSRVGSTSGAVSVIFSTTGGTATGAAQADDGVDYISKTVTLNFAAGEVSKVMEVDILQDSHRESNETLSASISLLSGGGTVETSSATLRILDDDHSVWSVVADQQSVVESATSVSFTITRTGSTGAADILFSANAGSATPGSDYDAITNQTVSFAEGEMSKTVVVTLTDDIAPELDETVIASITAITASGGTVDANGASATVNILDDDQSIFSLSAATEVSETAGYIVYTISRTGSSQETTVGLLTTGGTASGGAVLIDGVDYKTTRLIDGNAIVFAQGEMEKIVKIQIHNDPLVEGTETVSAMLTQAGTGSALSSNSAVTTNIIDDDSTVWALRSDTQNVDEGAGSITFTITRQGNTSQQTITFATAGGSATAGQDYVLAGSQQITFDEGVMSNTVTVTLLDDDIFEGVESLSGFISSPTGGVITTGSVVVNIIDNEQSLWNITKVSDAQEGQSLMVRVWRSGSLAAATINLLTSSAQAEVGSDYVDGSQLLSFAEGEESKTISFASLIDALPEPTEYISARIARPTQGAVSVSETTLALYDTQLTTWNVTSAGNDRITEGGTLAFTVTRTGNISQSATIQVGVSGEGSVVAGTDYVAQAPQTLTFAAGEVSKNYFVETLPNTTTDNQRAVRVILTGASTGTLEKSSAIGIILDDEAPAWSIITLNDADEGSRMAFVVSRTGGRQEASINVASVGGTAIGGTGPGDAVDYERIRQTLNFAEGEMEKIIWVNTYNDSSAENNKTVVMAISEPSLGVFSQERAIGTLLDNDGMLWAIRGVSGGVEGSPLVFEVFRTGGDLSEATITVGHNGFNAIANMDYTALWQTLTFAEGQKSQLVTVQSINDTLPEGTETVSLLIGNASKGFIGSDWSASTTIIDDDASTPVFGIRATSSVNEGSGLATITVTRTGAINGTVSVDYTTVDGVVTSANNVVPDMTAAARAGVHYTAQGGTLTFAPGETTKSFNISLIDNALVDGAKTFSVALLNPSHGVVQSTGATVGVATVVIADNESGGAASTTYGFVANNLIETEETTVYESSGAGIFTLARSGDLSPTTTYFRTNGGTAEAGTHYTAVTKEINWLEGQTRQSVFINLTDDNLLNGTRTVVGQHSTDQTNWTSSTLSILDDEATFSGGAVSYSLTSGYYTSSEGGGAFYRVRRDGDLSGTTTSYIALYSADMTRDVQYEWDATTLGDVSTQGTTAGGRHYATLTWAPGEVFKSVAVLFLDDGAPSGRQTLTARIAVDFSELTATTNTATTTATNLIKGFDPQAVTLTDAAQESDSSTRRVLDMAGGNDIYSYSWTEASASDQINLGAGNDLLECGIAPGFMVTTGFVVDGGTGLDVFSLRTNNDYYNANNVASYHFDFSNHYNSFYGLEMLRLSRNSTNNDPTTGKDMVSFNLATLVEMTKDNLNPYVFKVVSSDTTTGMNDTFRVSDTLGKTLYTPAVGSTFTDIDGQTGTVVADSDGDGANEVVFARDQGFALAYQFNGLTPTTFDIFQYDHDGQRMSILVQKDIHFIGSQPKATLTSGTGNDSGTATVSSTVQGMAYLVKDSVGVTNLASITATADDVWNSVAISGTSIDTSMSLAGLSEGSYHLYTTAIDGTLSKAATVNGAVTTFTVDNTPPAALSLVMPTNTLPGATPYAHVQGLETAAGTTWQYKIGSGNWTTGSGSSFALPADYQANPDEVQVRQIDVAGNVGDVRSSADATGVTSATNAFNLSAWLRGADDLASGGTETFRMVNGELARVHTFNTVTGTTTLNSNFANTSGAQLDLMYTLVGGGGAGGTSQTTAGGGGGGGFVTNGTASVQGGSSTAITVGAGGTQSTAFGVSNAGGSTSAAFTAGTVTAVGGMGGAGSSTLTATGASANTVGGTGGGGGGVGSVAVRIGTDTAAPTFQNARINANDATKVNLVYNELLDTSSVPAGSAFTVTVAGSARTVSSVAIVGNVVQLTLASGVTAGQAVTVRYTQPGSDQVKDLAGNLAPTIGSALGATNSFGGTEAVTPVINSVQLDNSTGTSRLMVVYNELLDASNPPAIARFTVMNHSTVTATAISVTGVQVQGATVVLTLGSTLATGTPLLLTYTDPSTGNDATGVIQDLLGNDAATVTAAYSGAQGLNGAGRGGNGWSQSGGGGGGAGGNGGDATGTGAGLAGVGGAGAVSTITGETYGGGGGGGTRQATSIAGGTGGGGAGGMELYADVSNPTTDTGAPAMSNARINAGNASRINLIYNEQLDPYNLPSTLAYTVTVAGSAVAVTSLQVVGNVLQLNLASSVTIGQTVTVSYTDATAWATLQDLHGNDAPTFSNQAVIIPTLGLETSAPVRIGTNMRLGSNQLTLEYSELLDASNLPPVNSFMVVEVVTGASIGVTHVQVQGASVVLTLDQSVAAGRTVGVRYTDPTAGNDTLAIQDLFGNDAASVVNGLTNEGGYNNLSLSNGTDGLGGGGGGGAGPSGLRNMGGRGGSGAAILGYESTFSETDLLTLLQTIENTEGGTATTLVQSSLHTYLNAIENASRTNTNWVWTDAQIAAVL
jgi:uncharacterized repeat protein (TIGR02059 family)